MARGGAARQHPAPPIFRDVASKHRLSPDGVNLAGFLFAGDELVALPQEQDRGLVEDALTAGKALGSNGAGRDCHVQNLPNDR